MEDNQQGYEKKTFLSVIILLAVLVVLVAGTIILGQFDILKGYLPLKINFTLAGLFMLIIARIIKKKNRVYWIPGIKYEDACKMNPVERKRQSEIYCGKVTRIMTVFIIYMACALICNTQISLDATIFVIALIYTGMKTSTNSDV